LNALSPASRFPASGIKSWFLILPFQSRQLSRVENPRKLAAAFALAVTAPTAVGHGWIARKGNESLFATLRRILPEVIEIYVFRILKIW
jgi:hypothetical protein